MFISSSKNYGLLLLYVFIMFEFILYAFIYKNGLKQTKTSVLKEK